ncbi:Vesicle coat protein involved in Golgi to plasma membrane transport [Leishmania naiffi]|uniref:Vesicle coat protein involved in Golgi to plasma membrane transport n=1 Tax=Leishmania naiffi TaxID=5678 RepID=A0AAW3BHK3_9TRYP
MLEIPAAFIGEFDALDGPKVTYAFEYFDFNRVAKNSSIVRQLLCFIEGKTLLGKHVASGLLHHECQDYLNSVAAHVLTSNESREERLLYQESGCPCVGSFLFSIPDIVARGEKRRFCLIFLHPSYHELVARWDYLSCFAEVLLRRWTQRATARYQQEYATVANLEQLREESRRKPLRSLTELLSLPDPGSDSALTSAAAQELVMENMHCQFEVVLPQALSEPIPLSSHDKEAAQRDAERILEDRLPFAQSCIDRVNTDAAHLRNGDILMLQFVKQLVFVDAEIVVKPLPLWLLQFFSDTAVESAPEAAVHILLRALFSGNQILITGEDARDCASLAMTLAYTLPPTLVKMHLGSETYRMPYESRLLTFSQHALSKYLFVPSPTAALELSSPHIMKLFDMEADGIVHVRVDHQRICSIQDCDQLRRAAQRRERQAEENETTVEPTTLENRILTLLQPYTAYSREQSSISVSALQLLTTQMHQLVSEYVLRGRVYGQLFSKQEVEENSMPLTPESSSPLASLAKSPLRASASSLMGQRHFFTGSGWRSSLYSGAPQSALSSASSGEAAAAERQSLASSSITKRAHLSPVYGKQFQQQHYVFSSFAPEDHAILVFLGRA